MRQGSDQTSTPTTSAAPTGGVSACRQIEDTILDELHAQRAQHRAARGYQPGRGPVPFVPPLGCSLYDLTPTELAQLLFYIETGRIQLVVRGAA